MSNQSLTVRVRSQTYRIKPRFHDAHKFGKNFTEIFYLIESAFEDRQAQSFDRLKRFENGRNSVGDDRRPGRASTSRTNDTIALVREKNLKRTTIDRNRSSSQVKSRRLDWFSTFGFNRGIVYEKGIRKISTEIINKETEWTCVWN